MFLVERHNTSDHVVGKYLADKLNIEDVFTDIDYTRRKTDDTDPETRKTGPKRGKDTWENNKEKRDIHYQDILKF